MNLYNTFEEVSANIDNFSCSNKLIFSTIESNTVSVFNIFQELKKDLSFKIFNHKAFSQKWLNLADLFDYTHKIAIIITTEDIVSPSEKNIIQKLINYLSIASGIILSHCSVCNEVCKNQESHLLLTTMKVDDNKKYNYGTVVDEDRNEYNYRLLENIKTQMVKIAEILLLKLMEYLKLMNLEKLNAKSKDSMFL